jgi:redox-sensitive bicupin YhaK (pirin superfamily)
MPRDIAAVTGSEIPERKGPGSRIRVLGESPMMLDIHMAARSTVLQAAPADGEAFIYVLDGELTVGGTKLLKGEMGRLGGGGDVEITAGPVGARSILCAGVRSAL